MQIGMVGLGRMGGNMARRLMKGGHEVVGLRDRRRRPSRRSPARAARGTTHLDDFVSKLEPPRVAWVMVPAGAATEQIVTDLAERMQPGDTIIDGGNSFYKDDVRRPKRCAPAGLHYVDVGTSGGVWGLERGYCLMIGGEQDGGRAPRSDLQDPGAGAGHDRPVRRAETSRAAAPPSRAISTAARRAPATSSRWCTTASSTASCRPTPRDSTSSRTPTPRISTADLRYDLDCADIAEVWRRGSVVCSWLLDLTAQALAENPDARRTTPASSQDSGEGRWTLIAAIEEGVPADVLSAALYVRFRSRQDHTFAEKVLSAMRHKFGGHVERAAGG